MPTHPFDPAPPPPAGEPAAPANPTRLPIEPEFGPVLTPAEPEDPGARPPQI